MPTLEEVKSQQQKAAIALAQFNRLKNDLFRNEINLGISLWDIHSNGFFRVYGFRSFPKWVKSALPTLRYSRSYYLCRIGEMVQTLGLRPDDLQKTPMTLLRVLASSWKQMKPAEVTRLICKGDTRDRARLQERFGRRGGWSLAFTVHTKTDEKFVSSLINQLAGIRKITKGEALVAICKGYREYASQKALAACV